VSADRERLVTEAFVSLADRLVGLFDVVELLTDLTESCARLLDVASAGLLLADRSDVLHVLAASSEAARSLELFQLQRAEGPCLECFRSGTAVRVPSLANREGRWPQFAPAARNLGFASVHAVPMRLHDQMLGALGLFGTSVGALKDDDLALGQALADVASVALVTGNATADRAVLTEHLQTALDSRVFIEQAKGAIAQYANLDMDAAFALLRKYARDHNQKLTDLAQTVASRSLPVQQVVDHSQFTQPRRRP
jgi:hypothetical protein